MSHSQAVIGGDSLQIWRVGTNILNKQLWTANKGWFSSLGVGLGGNSSSRVVKRAKEPWTWTDPFIILKRISNKWNGEMR